jgi:hypothetical protein
MDWRRIAVPRPVCGGQIDRWTEGQIDRWKPNLAGNLSGPLCVFDQAYTPLPEFRDDSFRAPQVMLVYVSYIGFFIGQKFVIYYYDSFNNFIAFTTIVENVKVPRIFHIKQHLASVLPLSAFSFLHIRVSHKRSHFLCAQCFSTCICTQCKHNVTLCH